MLNFIISPSHKANATDNIREAGLQVQRAELQQQKLTEELERLKQLANQCENCLKKTGLNDEELKKKFSLITT